MPESSESHQGIRQRILAIRRELTEEEHREGSIQACRRLIQALQERKIEVKSRTVGLYRGFKSELSLSELEKWLVWRGARLVYPRIQDPARPEFEMACMPDPLQPDYWRSGHFGIEEPHPNECQAVSPAEIDLIIVPGVAFDSQGSRIGMGRGFYDRYLRKCSRSLKVAVVFDFQLVPDFVPQPWDVAVDWIFSEVRELGTPRLAEWSAGR